MAVVAQSRVISGLLVFLGSVACADALRMRDGLFPRVLRRKLAIQEMDFFFVRQAVAEFRQVLRNFGDGGIDRVNACRCRFVLFERRFHFVGFQ